MIVGRMVADSPAATLSSISTMATSQPRASRYSAHSVPTRPPPMTATFPETSARPASRSQEETTFSESAPGTGTATSWAPTATMAASAALRSSAPAGWLSSTFTPSPGKAFS